jgi:regulator of sigma E protease
MAYIFAILGLSLLIVLHELGHMLTARLAGMRVITFSIGFGPALLRWRGRKTTYQLALIPLGGYVQIAGMNPNDKLPPDDPGSYANKSLLARFATIFAGPATNYLVAMLVMIFVGLAWGIPHQRPMVAEVVKGSPAQRGGMMAGDVIERINGEHVLSTEAVLGHIHASEGKELTFAVRRKDQLRPLYIAPAKEKVGYRIGIRFGQKMSFIEVEAKSALLFGPYFVYSQSRRFLDGIGGILAKLFRGEETGQQVGGPVEIVRQLKSSFELSPKMAVVFLSMLSVVLGLLNLMPIPALDGGRLLFLLTSAVARRQLNQRIENSVHLVGFVLLLGLILLVTVCNDVPRLVE